MSSTIWLVLADFALYVHFAFVLFIILGLLLVVVGGNSGWRWVRNPWFRYAHLAGIGVVVAQAWMGIICPLTTLEQYLRRQAGGAVYEGSYIAHWISELLYLDFPTWVYTVIYTVFGLLVAASWLWIRPRSFCHLRVSH